MTVEIQDTAPLGLNIIGDIGFVLCCASSSFFLLAIFLHFTTNRSRALDSLSCNAYGMYLIHYVFVVWLQYALLRAPLGAVAKATIVFGVALALSWATSSALLHLPLRAWSTSR